MEASESETYILGSIIIHLTLFEGVNNLKLQIYNTVFLTYGNVLVF